MTRPINIVLVESIVIGAMNMSLFWILSSQFKRMPAIQILFLCGALIHLIFEYIGANKWWCTQTYKL